MSRCPGGTNHLGGGGGGGVEDGGNGREVDRRREVEEGGEEGRREGSGRWRKEEGGAKVNRLAAAAIPTPTVCVPSSPPAHSEVMTCPHLGALHAANERPFIFQGTKNPFCNDLCTFQCLMRQNDLYSLGNKGSKNICLLLRPKWLALP